MARDFIIENKAISKYTRKAIDAVGDQELVMNAVCLFSNSSGLYAGGREDGLINGVGRWDGKKWHPTGDLPCNSHNWYDGRNTPVNVIFEYKRQLYCCLAFYSSPLGKEGTFLYKYNKLRKVWTPVKIKEDNRISGVVINRVIVKDNNVYFFGTISFGNILNNEELIVNILKWDGKTFTDIVKSTPDPFNPTYDVCCAINTPRGIFYTICNENKIYRLHNDLVEMYHDLSWNWQTSINDMQYAQNKIILGCSVPATQQSLFSLDEQKNINPIGNVTGSIATFASSSHGIYFSGIHSYGNLAIWNGIAINELPNSRINSLNSISSMLASNNGVFLSGYAFFDIGSKTSPVVFHDGESYINLCGDGLQKKSWSFVEGAISSSEGVYFMGNFWGKSGNGMTLWDGKKFNNLGNGLYKYSFFVDFCSSSQGIYTNKGLYENDPQIPGTGNLSFWNGSSWSDIPTDINITSLCANGDDIVFGGYDNPHQGQDYPTQIVLDWNLYKRTGNITTKIVTVENVDAVEVNQIVSCSTDIYCHFYRANSYGLINKLYKWNGSSLSEFDVPHTLARWPLTKYIYTDSSNLYMQPNGYHFDSNLTASILKFDGSSWTEIYIPQPYSGAGLTLVGSSSNGFILKAQNRDPSELQKLLDGDHYKRSFYPIYFYNNQLTLIDYTGPENGVYSSITCSEGIYLYGPQAHHGVSINLYSEKEFKTIKPIIYNNNNVATLNCQSAYEVKIG